MKKHCEIALNSLILSTYELYAIVCFYLFLGKPQITNKSDIIYAASETAVKLNVSYFSNDGTEPVTHWFKVVNDTKVQINSTQGRIHYKTIPHDVQVLYYHVKIIQAGYMTQLLIQDIQAEDFVEYEVEIVNSLDMVSHQSVLKARGKLCGRLNCFPSYVRNRAQNKSFSTKNY